MPTTINASNTTGGAVVTGDGSGILELQSGGVTGITVNGANVTVAGTLTATGGIPAITTALTSPVSITGNSTAGAEIRLPEDTDNGSNYVALKAANALAANLTFTLPAADGTNGQYLQTNGSGALSFSSVVTASIQEFSSSGTWTKPAGAQFVMVECWGAGGGGGSGSRSGGNGSGGSGGGGGAYAYCIFKASDLGATVAVTVGAGGTAGAAISTNATVGQNGGTGGNTSFGTLLFAYGGGPGIGGGIGSNSAGGNGGGVLSVGGTGAVGEPATGQFGGALGTNSANGLPSGFGGGAGGSARTSNNAYNGGCSYQGGAGGGGGGYWGGWWGGAGGSRAGANGGGGSGGQSGPPSVPAGNGVTFGFGGGGGWGGFSTTNGGAGGNGGLVGGGGGGGAGNDGTSVSGAGGIGGAGYCRVYTW